VTARYSIWVREHGSDHDVELMQVDTNPEALMKVLRGRQLKIRHSIFTPGKRVGKTPKYVRVYMVDHGAD
jgi:hypothetical protein